MNLNMLHHINLPLPTTRLPVKTICPRNQRSKLSAMAVAHITSGDQGHGDVKIRLTPHGNVQTFAAKGMPLYDSFRFLNVFDSSQYSKIIQTIEDGSNGCRQKLTCRNLCFPPKEIPATPSNHSLHHSRMMHMQL